MNERIKNAINSIDTSGFDGVKIELWNKIVKALERSDLQDILTAKVLVDGACYRCDGELFIWKGSYFCNGDESFLKGCFDKIELVALPK